MCGDALSSQQALDMIWPVLLDVRFVHEIRGETFIAVSRLIFILIGSKKWYLAVPWCSHCAHKQRIISFDESPGLYAD
jgi:hypothetical protein